MRPGETILVDHGHAQLVFLAGPVRLQHDGAIRSRKSLGQERGKTEAAAKRKLTRARAGRRSAKTRGRGAQRHDGRNRSSAAGAGQQGKSTPGVNYTANRSSGRATNPDDPEPIVTRRRLRQKDFKMPHPKANPNRSVGTAGCDRQR